MQLIYLLIIVLVVLALGQITSREGYESLTNCIDQGYPRSFCLKGPIQSVIDDGYCYCANRQLGTRKSDGECHCFPFDPTFPYYTTKTFRDFPK